MAMKVAAFAVGSGMWPSLVIKVAFKETSLAADIFVT